MDGATKNYTSTARNPATRSACVSNRLLICGSYLSTRSLRRRSLPRSALPSSSRSEASFLFVQMGRGLASKGKRAEGSAPDWLNPIKEGEGGGGGGFGGGSSVRQVEEEKPRKRRGGDDDDLDEPVKKGIQWKPLAFLVLMVLPGLAPVLISVAERLQAYGFKMPSFSANPYRPCLQEYYADWAPEKLGALDETLAKYEGKERQLFGALKNKYGKPVNFARCAPPKEK